MQKEMEDIYRLAISNMATGLQDLEDRVAYLEGQLDKPAPHQTAFDLARYRKLLETCISSRKQAAKTTDQVEYFERCHIKIEAYEHALKLLDA